MNNLKKQESLPKRLMGKKELDIYINKVYSLIYSLTNIIMKLSLLNLKMLIKYNI
jgi:hypothetical protein